MIYTSVIQFYKDVKLDLKTVELNDPKAYPAILALMRQMMADPKLAEHLLNHGHGDKRTAPENAQKWLSEWKRGKDLWRLKFWDLEDQKFLYRFLYVYLVKEARFVVMAIVKREEFDYDDINHPIRLRVYASLQRTYGIGDWATRV